jgi:hypothetical protein
MAALARHPLNDLHIPSRCRDLQLKKESGSQVDTKFVKLVVISLILPLIAFYAYYWLNPTPPVSTW